MYWPFIKIFNQLLASVIGLQRLVCIFWDVIVDG